MRAAAIIIATLWTANFFAQTSTFAKKAQQLTGTFNVYHIDPPPNTENVSSEIIDLFIADLDNSGLILNESNVSALKKNSGNLFTQVNSQSNDYILSAEKTFVKALGSLDSILNSISLKPLDLAANDTLFFLPAQSKVQYSATLKTHAKRIEKYIKYKAFEKVSTTDSYATLAENDFNAKAQEFSKSIIDNLRKSIQKQIATASSIVEFTLLNAIALRYDPHSNYFNQEQNQEFNQQLSSTVESFGFQLDEDEEGAISIAAIDPGGSAWLSNEINEGDLFISVKIGFAFIGNGDGTADEIQSKIDNSSEKIILLSLKKPNGLIKKVKLIKQKISSEENTVKGYVLKNKNFNIGYISLPSFYTDMEEHNLPGCANDVAKEILKLERDSIRGLIIDLRNNGGGSMQEAMNLAGIFIDEGPLFIYKEKNKKPTLIKDINRGSIFKKPIVVMVNETSASASELFSNIVKDYNLGLIVGQSTYGKGTAQNVLPLDSNLSRSPAYLKANTDFIKITTAKFYRLNCSTHQGNGVVPDIELPALAGYSNYKESKELFYLRPDSVTKKVVYLPNASIKTESIRAKSNERVSRSEEFKKLKTVSDSLNLKFSSVQKIPLKFTAFKKYKTEMEVANTSFENSLKSKNKVVSCLNNSFDKDLNEVSTQVKEFNAKILKSIEEDIFINESFGIIKDLINP